MNNFDTEKTKELQRLIAEKYEKHFDSTRSLTAAILAGESCSLIAIEVARRAAKEAEENGGTRIKFSRLREIRAEIFESGCSEKAPDS